LGKVEVKDKLEGLGEVFLEATAERLLPCGRPPVNLNLNLNLNLPPLRNYQKLTTKLK
jgi:hypothetical protein